MSTASSDEQPIFDVVSPLGRGRAAVGVEHRPLDTLDGKTVGFIWDYLFKGDEMFAAIERAVSAEHPDARFVDYPNFGNIHGSSPDERANIGAIAARIREANVDAVVVAVGA
jgi:hypothetical protein